MQIFLFFNKIITHCCLKTHSSTNSSCQKKRENCMRAGRRQGGGVEQLHAIAQNHSTIILPSHKSPNNTEPLLAIFKTTQKRFLQMVGKTKNLQVVFIFSSWNHSWIQLIFQSVLSTFFKIIWGCLIVATAHHWQTAVPSSSCELPLLLPGRRKPKKEEKGALSQKRQWPPLKIYEKLPLAP